MIIVNRMIRLTLLFLLLSTLICLSIAGSVVFQQRPICGGEKNFEMTFTAHLQEHTHLSALETFVFKTKVRPLGDKAQLLLDIDTMLSSYGVVNNAADIAAVIHSHYDAYLDKLISSSGDVEDCPKVPVLDLGYEQHQLSKSSLSSLATLVRNEGMKHASEVLTVVSGYWNVQTNKYSTPDQSNPYEHWLHNSLRLHMPYVMFTDQKHVELIQDCRTDLPTLIALRNMEEFLTHRSYNTSWIHSEHVPSAALASIWLEKINLLLLASQLTNTTYYAWVDAALSTYRDIPFPPEEWSLDVVMSLPTKRISYAHVTGAYHSFAAGVIIVHRDLIPVLHTLFYEEYEQCIQVIQDWRCGSEQFLLTAIRDRLPHLFHAMSYEYGDISPLWANRYPIVLKKNA